MPHPPHYEQLPSCPLARPGCGAEGTGGKAGGKWAEGRGAAVFGSGYNSCCIGTSQRRGLLGFQFARRGRKSGEGFRAGSGVFRAQAGAGADLLKGAPGRHCGAIQQPGLFLRSPHGGSREPKRRAWSGGLGSDAQRRTRRPRMSESPRVPLSPVGFNPRPPGP